jgi:hypothetical protein
MPAEDLPVTPPAGDRFSATPRKATFHYADEAPIRIEAVVAGEPVEAPVAVLVCHGMGEQVRFETVGQIAGAILTHANAAGCEIDPNGVQISYHDGSFLARAELNWSRGGKHHQVHVYEAYWAPVTEGKVTYAETLQFLLQAAWRGFRCSRFFRTATFQRWMFDDMQDVTISAWTKILLVIVAALLLVEAATIAFVTFRVAAGVKEISSLVWPTMPPLHLLFEHFWTWLGLFAGFLRDSVLQVLKPFLPAHAALHHPGTVKHWFAAVAQTVAWLAMIAQAFFVRYFLIEYAGDVAAYISPFKASKFDSIRSEIQAIGLNVARVIYGFDAVRGVPHYGRIVIAGHSLGSVLAYDTLNAIFNLDRATLGDRHAVERTTHLITFGSPLDKTAFLFRNQSNHIADPIREQMAAGMQPLIRSYPEFRRHLRWINLWSRMDIISGKLEYYDVAPEGDPLHVQNREDPDARTPLVAHVQYWDGRLLAEELYRAVR